MAGALRALNTTVSGELCLLHASPAPVVHILRSVGRVGDLAPFRKHRTAGAPT